MNIDCLITVYAHKFRCSSLKEITTLMSEKMLSNSYKSSAESLLRANLKKKIHHTQDVVFEYIDTIDPNTLTISIPSDLKSLNEMFARDSEYRETIRNLIVKEVHKLTNAVLIQHGLSFDTIRIIYGQTSSEMLPCLNAEQWFKLYNQ